MQDNKKRILEMLHAGVKTVVAPAKELTNAIAEDVQALRESAPAKLLDKGIEIADKVAGPSGKAWLANGLDELRQAVALGNGQIQAGNNPGIWGSITTGEATAERMGDLSLDDMRGYAAARAKEAEKAMDRGNTHEQNKEQER